MIKSSTCWPCSEATGGKLNSLLQFIIIPCYLIPPESRPCSGEPASSRTPFLAIHGEGQGLRGDSTSPGLYGRRLPPPRRTVSQGKRKMTPRLPAPRRSPPAGSDRKSVV